MRKSTLATPQYSLDEHGGLVVRPKSLQPYAIGAVSLAMGALITFSYLTAPETKALAWFVLAILLFFGGGAAITVRRLAGFPRLRVRGHVLTLEDYFGRPVDSDISKLGRAFAFPMQRSVFIGFPRIEEEYALHMTGRRHELDKFNAAQVVNVTSMVGMNLRHARDIAHAINRHRSRAPRPNLEYDEIRTIAATTDRKRAWAVVFITMMLVVGAVLKALLD